ncbi:unnamed protein product [Heligmosomoides polygyrus]|uniref:Endo/exonuclease/phosphatase domain-containing protein n=1 Tax=Heligmosomoides polygyrus TaxID=6339 RepID=A0A183GG37_HELPZ|nr:unnamed protein product [Heligmosomoides polygyrus]
MKIVVAAKERLYQFFSAYASQTGCSDQAKDEFWSLLDEKTAEVPSKDVIIVADDLNGHVGATKDGYRCHGGFGYGSRNADGERILEYAESHNLTIVNTVFRKRDSHLIQYYSGSSKSQIDFVVVKDRDRSLVTDAKVVPYETVAPQQRPLICTLRIAPPRQKQVERCGAPRMKWWRMGEKEFLACGYRQSQLSTKLGRRLPTRYVKLQERKSLCHVFLGDKRADNWRKYEEARKAAKKAVAVAKATHYGDVNEKLELHDERPSSDRPQKGAEAMACYFEEVSTMEFPHPAIPSVAFVHGPVHKITVEETKAALRKMRPGKATGSDDVAADLWKSKLWYHAEW